MNGAVNAAPVSVRENHGEKNFWICEGQQQRAKSGSTGHSTAGTTYHTETAEGGNRSSKAKGKHLGRPGTKEPVGFEKAYREWKAGKMTARRAMQILGLKCSTFYRMVQKHILQR